MEPTPRTPNLEEVIGDKKEFEHNLEIAKEKFLQLNTEINNLKFNVKSLQKDIEELIKTEKYYESKYSLNAKHLHNLAFIKRKYEMNIRWFEIYKLNMPIQNINEDKYAEVVEQQAKLIRQKETMLAQKEELTQVIYNNNQKYRDILEKIKNSDILTLIK